MGEMEERKSTQIQDQDWEQRCEQASIPTEDLNKLIIDFLATEGYLDAASAFAEESGTSMDGLDTSEDRMHIRTALENGNIEDAISRVNDLNPEILESDAELFFHLQQQQMIELIRDGRIVDALLFAQEYLAYKGEENPSILDELENTIALIAFEDPMKCPVKHLMESQQRQRIANETNQAILRHLNYRTEPKLAYLVKMLAWCQDKLEGRKVKFPRLQDLQLSHGTD